MKFLPPDLDGVHADLGREEVDHALDRLRRLGPPGAAERASIGVVFVTTDFPSTSMRGIA